MKKPKTKKISRGKNRLGLFAWMGQSMTRIGNFILKLHNNGVSMNLGLNFLLNNTQKLSYALFARLANCFVTKDFDVQLLKFK